MSPSFARASLRACALLAFAAALAAQAPRPLTHDDYDAWRSLRSTTYTHDGSWVAYQIEPQFGDGVLEVRQSTGDVVHRVPLASGPRFSADGKKLVFTVGKSKVEERNKKIDDLRKKKTEAEKGEKAPAAEGERAAPEARRPGGAGPGGAGPGGGRGAGGLGGFQGRRGGAGGPPGAAGGAADDTSRERSELAVLDLATGRIEKLGRAKGHTLHGELPILLYQPEKAEAKTEAKPDAKPDEGAAKPEGGEPAAKPAEPVAAEPAAAAEPKSEPAGEPNTGARSESGEGRAARPSGAPGAGNRRPGGPPADPLEQKRPEGSDLVLRDLATGAERRIADVVAYGLSRNGKWLWYHTSVKKPVPGARYGVFVVPPQGGEPIQVLDGIAHVANATFDRSEQALAFTSDLADFAADKPNSDLYLWDGSAGPARAVVHAGNLPPGKRLGGSVSFSRDGSVLAFGIANPPEPEPLAILPEDKVVLDLWNWRDGSLQTQQQKSPGRRGSTLDAVYHRDQDRVVVLGDERVPSWRFVGPDGARLIGTDGKDYDQEVSWDGRYVDVYLGNGLDGSRQKILTKLRGNVQNAPGGRYLLWFAEQKWWSHDVATGQRRDLTGSLPVAFHKEDDDHPEEVGGYGVAGWTEGDAAVLLYDQFDVWQITPATGEAVCVTDGYGRANRLSLRVQSLPRAYDSDYLPEQLVLTATQVDTMAEGVFVDWLGRVQKPQRLWWADRNLAELTRPKHSTRFFFTLSTFAEFPDLWTANAEFSDMRRLSDANPQQREFRWGKAEIVQWIDGDGKPARGVLVKPDGFDPKHKYPMLVYFYERMAQNLHNYVAPAPGTSPNASYYVSNGYLWFMPDVRYEIGYPGQSCVKCVVSGVQHLLAQGFVDPKGIGAAGHSWGGYQTAFLVTRTNIFAAVESGAPVSNMISAYGGIRYETGMSRQFQYEKTQSRIGGTPWQYPMRYWENSPIFFADKVQTPVLILANDQDGAVPWTQGIEYFTALRRLGKECYLFNYNGEGHGLRQRQNLRDWTRRMSEYFAHHLQGAPAPKWMTDGVPYHERDAEKLPYAPSYIDAYLKPAPVPVPTPAPATASEAAAPKTAGAGASGGEDPAGRGK